MDFAFFASVSFKHHWPAPVMRIVRSGDKHGGSKGKIIWWQAGTYFGRHCMRTAPCLRPGRRSRCLRRATLRRAFACLLRGLLFPTRMDLHEKPNLWQSAATVPGIMVPEEQQEMKNRPDRVAGGIAAQGSAHRLHRPGNKPTAGRGLPARFSPSRVVSTNSALAASPHSGGNGPHGCR